MIEIHTLHFNGLHTGISNNSGFFYFSHQHSHRPPPAHDMVSERLLERTYELFLAHGLPHGFVVASRGINLRRFSSFTETSHR